jgi:epoxyqueuosine reductase
VLGNRGDDAALPALTHAMTDEDPVVRGHAAWAIGRIAPGHASLDQARGRESDDRVLGEIERARES